MKRIKLALIAGGALFAAPSLAVAQGDPEPAPVVEGEASAGGEFGAGDATPTVDAPSTGHTMSWPKEIIDRPLTVLAGKFGFGADFYVAHASITLAGMTSSSTSEGIALVGGYGISDDLEVGGSYAFALNEFEIKGPLTLFGNFNLTNDGKLAVGAGAGLVLDFNGTDIMTGDSQTDVSLVVGLGVRYKLAPKFAVFTGNPWAPGLLGDHLKLGLSGDETKSFSIPIGFAMQATPELFAYISTNLATILLSDPGMGDRVSLISDFTPLTLGGWFALTTNVDVGASVIFPDLQNAGDFWAITVGARYFN